MSIALFKEEVLNHYLDQDLQITVDRDPSKWSTGNGLLHASIFYSILYLNNAIEKRDIDRLSQCINLCWAGITKPIVGLLERDNGRDDLEAHDDYHIVTASHLLGTYHSESIWNWGDTHNWSFNNVYPNKWTWRTWHRRFVGHVPYLYLAANKSICWLDRLEINSYLWLSDTSNAQAVMQAWLKIQVFKKLKMFSPQIEHWEKSVQKEWGSLGAALEPYFGSGHPFSKISTMSGVFNG